MPTVNQLIRKSRKKVVVKSTAPDMMENPQKRGVCTRVYTTTPKKPNSAQRNMNAAPVLGLVVAFIFFLVLMLLLYFLSTEQ